VTDIQGFLVCLSRLVELGYFWFLGHDKAKFNSFWIELVAIDMPNIWRNDINSMQIEVFMVFNEA